MDEGPFAAFTHPDCDRLHDTAACRTSISGSDVEMEAKQTSWTMVSMIGSGAAAANDGAAISAAKRRLAGVGRMCRVMTSIFVSPGISRAGFGFFQVWVPNSFFPFTAEQRDGDAQACAFDKK